jgi:hypothetical protein
LEKGEHGAGRGSSVALSCACGYSISCEVHPEGERIGYLAFFDDEPASEAFGERIESCPRCGQQLGLPLLYRINRPDQ